MNDAVILLVDDEIPFVEAMSKRLTKREFTVITATSGVEAIGKLETCDIDVVILDVKMPGMNGIETLRRIKEYRPLIEVIMLTGHGGVENAIEGMKLGAYDYIIKPCDMDVLLKRILEAKAQKVSHEEKIRRARMKEINMSH
jgi:DNA-binding NtrC family response regulator